MSTYKPRGFETLAEAMRELARRREAEAQGSSVWHILRINGSGTR
jgi:hypothetical protein